MNIAKLQFWVFLLIGIFVFPSFADAYATETSSSMSCQTADCESEKHEGSSCQDFSCNCACQCSHHHTQLNLYQADVPNLSMGQQEVYIQSFQFKKFAIVVYLQRPPRLA